MKRQLSQESYFLARQRKSHSMQKFAGSEIKLEDTEYIVIKQDGILAIIED